MDEKPFSLMTNLVPATHSKLHESQGGTIAFADIMEQLGYRSVFDILRKSPHSFARDVRTLSNADAELAYDNAVCYATQIVRQYRNQLISSGREPAITRRTGVRSLVEIGPSFPNLFKENWDRFCKVGAIEAKDSPVAYLTSIYRFALEELEEAIPDTKQIKLSMRRPDLKDLLLDHQTMLKPVPALEIVKKVLEASIQSYTHSEESYPQALYSLLANKKHPFLFPYSYCYQQIKLGLSENKPRLGEINYRISLQLPIYQDSANHYGKVQTPPITAQKLMGGLSPEQQSLLTEARELSDDTSESTAQFYKDYYDIMYSADIENSLVAASTFMEKSGLPADQLEVLLAINGSLPKRSPNAQANSANPSRSFGAQYINIHNASGSALPIEIDNETKHLTQTNNNSFDRMQRIIRLQRWTSLPFTELDTLICAAARSQQDNPDLYLNTNTLRALGVYFYFQNHYTLGADEFSGFIHELGVYSIGDKPSMLDRIFNNPQLLDDPFKTDNTTIYLGGSASQQRATAKLCHAIGVQKTKDSLGVLIDDTYYHFNPANDNGSPDTAIPTTSLWSVSSFYRQSRIAQMFGLSVKDSRNLCELLGGTPYIHAIVSGRLSSVLDGTSPCDILDVLMQMDWAVKWLTETQRNVATVRLQLGVDTVVTPTSQNTLDALNQLARDSRAELITPERIDELNLPAVDADRVNIDWWTLLNPLLDSHGLVNSLLPTQGQTPEEQLRETIDTVLIALTLISKDEVAHRLTALFAQALQTQNSLVESLLHNLTQLPMDRAELVVRWAGVTIQTLLSQLLSATAETDLTKPLAELGQQLIRQIEAIGRYAEVALQLGISSQALQAFVLSPGWLDDTFTNQPLTLNLASLYLLDRYCRWVASMPWPEDQALTYLASANTDAPPDTCASALSPLIDWASSEITTATKILPTKKASTVSQIDWTMRVKACSKQTALSADALLKATALDPASSDIAPWQAVGDLVMAASR